MQSNEYVDGDVVTSRGAAPKRGTTENPWTAFAASGAGHTSTSVASMCAESGSAEYAVGTPSANGPRRAGKAYLTPYVRKSASARVFVARAPWRRSPATPSLAI